MRDAEGNVRSDAHLLGFLRRITKLLFIGIRPVFVFDGPAPALKRRTLASRRNLRDQSAQNMQRTAEKLLLAQLKAKNLQSLKRKLKGECSILPPLQEEEETDLRQEQNLFGSDSDEKQSSEDVEDEESWEDDEPVEDDEHIDLGDIDMMDASAVASLPYSMQYEILERRRHERGHGSRQRLVSASSTPKDFSSEQLDQFLTNTKFKAEVKSLREGLNVSGHHNGEATYRIAAQPDRAFYFRKTDSDHFKSRRIQRKRVAGSDAVRDLVPKRVRTLQEFSMQEWHCLSCESSNLRILNRCSGCGIVKPNEDLPLEKCDDEVGNVLPLPTIDDAIIDRSEEMDDLLGDLEDDADAVEDSKQNDLIEEQDSPEPQELPSEKEIISCPDEMLELRNSRLNFYRLQQQQSVPTRVQELIAASKAASDGPAPALDVSPPSSSISPTRSAAEPTTISDAVFDGRRPHQDPEPLVPSVPSEDDESSTEVEVVHSRPDLEVSVQAESESAPEKQLVVADIPPTPTLALEQRLERVEEMQYENRLETQQMQQQKKRYQRDADTVTDTMIEDTKHLLSLFGIPFIVAPAEAEAQCAQLELLDLVEGIVSDDSDVFLFGARKVFKNMFNANKLVECYDMKTVERELGLDRDKLVKMALMLGSDYTEGVHGVGIVNAIEIINSFNDLAQFRDWVYSSTTVERPSLDMVNDSAKVRRQKFKWKHRNIRRNWEVPRSFPSVDVVQSYFHPRVDKSTEGFSWASIDVAGVTAFLNAKLAWSPERVQQMLDPLVKAMRNPTFQTRLERYFGPTQRAAKIRSKRILTAVQGLTEQKKDDDDENNEAIAPHTIE